MIRSALTFFVAFTFVLYLTRPKMDRIAWATVAGLTAVATLASVVIGSMLGP